MFLSNTFNIIIFLIIFLIKSLFINLAAKYYYNNYIIIHKIKY